MENKKNILIVVDMQNDFVSGSLGSSDAVKILGNIRSKIKSYDSDDNGVIVFTRDTHSRNYLNTLEGRKLPVEHCIYNTKGWEIVDELNAPLEKTKKCIVDKGSFGFPEWERELSYMGLTSNNISGKLSSKYQKIKYTLQKRRYLFSIAFFFTYNIIWSAI